MDAEKLRLAQSFYALMLGEAHAVITPIPAEGIQLPDIPCAFVKLENWDTLQDFTTGNLDPIIWGYNQVFVHRILPGGNSELIPVSNANQIWCRTPEPGGTFQGSANLYWSYYRGASPR